MLNMIKLTRLKFSKMYIKPIKTKADYESAMARLELVFDAKRGTAEGDELEVLSILIEKYEDAYYPIGLPDPVEAIKFRMEQLGYSSSDLESVVGENSQISDILSRKVKLSLELIRKLHKVLNIPTDVLITEY